MTAFICRMFAAITGARNNWNRSDEAEAHRAAIIIKAAVLDDQRERDVLVAHRTVPRGVAMVVCRAGRRQQRHMLRPGEGLAADRRGAARLAQGQHQGSGVVDGGAGGGSRRGGGGGGAPRAGTARGRGRWGEADAAPRGGAGRGAASASPQ